MFYYTYVLQSSLDGSLYIGFTQDIECRLQQHNSGKVKSTKHKCPLKLIYYEACISKELAIKREKQLKSGFGRAYLKRRLDIN